VWTRTRQKARSRLSAPHAAGPPHVSAYLRINETCALKEAVSDLLGTDRCTLQFIFCPCRCRVNIRLVQDKVPVGRREDTSDSHSFSITAGHNMYSSRSPNSCHCICVHFPHTT
jgi:hypothetical protein